MSITCGDCERASGKVEGIEILSQRAVVYVVSKASSNTLKKTVIYAPIKRSESGFQIVVLSAASRIQVKSVLYIYHILKKVGAPYFTTNS